MEDVCMWPVLLKELCIFHRNTSGFWVSLAVKVTYICFMMFGCKILR